MLDRHLCQRPHHRQRNERSRRKTQNHRRAGKLHRNRTRQKKSGANRAAQRNHGHLCGAQLVLQTRLTLHQFRFAAGLIQLFRLSSVRHSVAC